MIWLSALIVFGAYAWYVRLLYWKSSTRAPGMRFFLHTPSPLPLIAPVVAGVLLGFASAVLDSNWWSWLVVAIEVVALGVIIAGVTVMSRLPAHQLKLAVGDLMPGFELIDQDGVKVCRGTGETHSPALFVFYRGH